MHTIVCDSTPMKPLGRAVEIPSASPRSGLAVVTGAVVQEETGDAIQGATVDLRPVDSTNANPISRYSDSKGGFSFDSLPPRGYLLRVRKIGENQNIRTISPVDARVDTVTVRLRADRCYGY